MAKKKIKFDATKARVATYDPEGNLLSEINGELKSDFYSGIEKMCYLSDDYCAFYKGKKKGIVDSQGEMIAPAEFESIKADGDVFQIGKKNKTTKDTETGYLNRQGDLLFDPSEYTPECIYASDGRIPVTCNDTGKYGAFDFEGNLVIPPTFFDLNGFHHNLAVASEEKGKFGLLNLDGSWALAPEYSSVGGFLRGIDELQDYCVAEKDGKYFLIDKDCNVVAGPVEERVQTTRNVEDPSPESWGGRGRE
ncbi:MAG: WG repeat-containing protein, partial [Muribaculaceae bacterium]|nr:WG repeat-containing protein [Muribaculaceae bacterium]